MKLEEVNTRTKEAVDFLVAALESGHSEVLTAYLGAMAKFHTYSFGNIMLIARQRPDATNVAGLRTWNSLGRFVKRGEKGIFILAPMVGRRSTKDVATEEPSDDATTCLRLTPVMVTTVPTAPLVGLTLVICGVTRNILLLVSVPLGVVTVTGPVVAPLGTV